MTVQLLGPFEQAFDKGHTPYPTLSLDLLHHTPILEHMFDHAPPCPPIRTLVRLDGPICPVSYAESGYSRYAWVRTNVLTMWPLVPDICIHSRAIWTYRRITFRDGRPHPGRVRLHVQCPFCSCPHNNTFCTRMSRYITPSRSNICSNTPCRNVRLSYGCPRMSILV